MKKTSLLITSILSFSFLNIMAEDSKKVDRSEQTAYIDIEDITKKSEEYRAKMNELGQEVQKQKERFEKMRQKGAALQAKLEDAEVSQEAKTKIAIELATLENTFKIEGGNAEKELYRKEQEIKGDIFGKIMEAAKKAGEQAGFGAVQPKFIVINKNLDLTEDTIKILNARYLEERKKAGDKKKDAAKKAGATTA